MRRFILLTCLAGALLTYLATAVVRTERLTGGGPLGVSSADLLDQGAVARLRLQQISVGGVVTAITPGGVVVHDKQGHALHIRFAHGSRFVERGATVGASALELGAHLTVRALHSGGTNYVGYTVTIS